MPASWSMLLCDCWKLLPCHLPLLYRRSVTRQLCAHTPAHSDCFITPGHFPPQIPQALLKHGATNYLTAVQAIPRNLRTMYIHAYQSYLWNSVASFRLRQSRSALLVGDLVAQSKTGAGGPDGSQEFVGSTDQVPLHSENGVDFTEPGANAQEAAAPANMVRHWVGHGRNSTLACTFSPLPCVQTCAGRVVDTHSNAHPSTACRRCT